MSKFREETAVQKELRQAIQANREIVDRLKKCELRKQEAAVKEQTELARAARDRLYRAWDAYRETLMEEDDGSAV